MIGKASIYILYFLISAPVWNLNFDEATKQAKDENKVILLNFAGSDWCAPCIKLTREVFDQSEFLDYAKENLVLVRADFPRLKKNQLSKEQVKHNEALADKYNSQGKFPLTLLVDAEGRVIHEWDGYQSVTPAEFISQINKFLSE